MISFSSKKFDELSTVELYEILALRAEVFVVEQNCPYQDVDGKDPFSLHVLGYIEDKMVAYARVLEKGISYPNYASIGRIVTSPFVRGKKYGHALVDFSIRVCRKNYPAQTIKISAQAQLEKFYRQHSFVSTGEPYLEDNIPHIGMIYTSKDEL